MLIPLPAVIIGLSLEKVKYNLQRFPPSICTTSSSEMRFYSIILPIDLFVCTGVVMLIVAMWNIRKVCHFLQFYKIMNLIIIIFRNPSSIKPLN